MDMVDWYAEKNSISEDKEESFYGRLAESLDSEIEKVFLNAYYQYASDKENLPALIPQVYLYYDPQTLRQRGYKIFEHQKMDFLMILSHRNRVVIEIDGKQHYAEGDFASPKLYAQMAKAGREMSLYGYDVYRFGGYELYQAVDDQLIREKTNDMIYNFFDRLFLKYSV